MVTPDPSFVPIGLESKRCVDPETQVDFSSHPLLDLMMDIKIRNESDHPGITTGVGRRRRETSTTGNRVGRIYRRALVDVTGGRHDDMTGRHHLGAFEISQSGRVEKNGAGVFGRRGVGKRAAQSFNALLDNREVRGPRRAREHHQHHASRQRGQTGQF